MMKQKIYNAGIIFFALAILGSLAKMMHYPGAAILLTLGFSGLILLFFPLGLISSYREKGERSLLPLYAVTYLTLLVIFTGMLFKILHWPGAGLLLLIGLPFPFVVFLPVFISVTGRIDKFSIHNIVAVLLLLSFISVFNGLLALNVAKDKINDSIFLASVYSRTAERARSYSSDLGQNSSETEIAAGKVLDLIAEAKEKFMEFTSSDVDALNEDPYSIRYSDSKYFPTEIMFRGNEPYLGDRLEASLSEFIDAIGIHGNSGITQEQARELLKYYSLKELPGLILSYT